MPSRHVDPWMFHTWLVVKPNSTNPSAANLYGICDQKDCCHAFSECPDMSIWVFPKIVVPQNGWFILENPIKMDDLGVPLFSETPISFLIYSWWLQPGPLKNMQKSKWGIIFPNFRGEHSKNI